MRILSVTAQKPNSTGSGFYLTELVKAFAKEGHTQAVLAGVYKEDAVSFPEGVGFYPLYFKTEELPFPIAGMSDEMPYESTVYGQMTEEMTEQFKAAFRRVIKKTIEDFKPNVIVCHHLYLVTSLVREITDTYFPQVKVCGFCHNTDLRQLKKIPLERAFIKEEICKLDAIFALHEEQKKEIETIFPVTEDQVTVAGTGYNSDVFYLQEEIKEKQKIEDEVQGYFPFRLIFAGKIAEKKGVASLIKALDYLPWSSEELEVYLAGGAGNQKEYAWICDLAEQSAFPIHFLGKMPQTELALLYNRCDVFVLPSFSEGLPLTIMEAMACGNKVIVTDLPGIRPWTEANVKDAPVVYVTPPEMENADEPVSGSLDRFEKELAGAIERSTLMPYDGYPDLSKVSWGNICRLVEQILS